MDPGSQLPSLSALRAFEAAAREGSFQAAARTLRLTPSAVSHQIRALELEFGQPLFLRRHRKVELTEAGRTLQAYVARGFDELKRGAAALRQDRQAGLLRVSAVPAFATAFLAYRIEAFEALNPGLQLRLEVSQAVVDFDLEPVDIGIRLGLAASPSLYSELILPITAAPVCTPELAGRLSVVADLAEVTRICISQDPRGWRAWFRAAGAEPPPEHDAIRRNRLIVKSCSEFKSAEPDSGFERSHPALGRELWFDSLSAGLHAAGDGLGVVLAPLPLVAQALRDGRLVRPFDTAVRSKMAYRLVCRRGEEDLPKIARFRRWLKRELATAA